jgi:septal ring factor EnvC (AmiA/AmiB activator)
MIELNNKRESEDETMDEKTINLICDSVKNAVSETNSKNAEYEAQIAELNNTIAEKDGVISELNASVEQIKKAIADMEAERDDWWAERDALQKQLGEALAAQRLNEMNSAIEGFTEEQRAFAKDEIEAFKADPMNSEINSITDKIYREIGRTALESAKVVETNSVDDTTDIFGEINSTNANTDGEDIDIFATVL